MDSTPTSPRLEFLRGSEERADDKWIDVDDKEDTKAPVKEIAENVLKHDKNDWVT